MSDRRQRMIEALDSLEVVDWSASCEEIAGVNATEGVES